MWCGVEWSGVEAVGGKAAARDTVVVKVVEAGLCLVERDTDTHMLKSASADISRRTMSSYTRHHTSRLCCPNVEPTCRWTRWVCVRSNIDDLHMRPKV